MDKTRTTPLAPLFSSMAILSFKKKSKGGDLGELSGSMGDLNLDGENLSLSDLGGSVGSLSKLEKKDKSADSLNDSILSMTSSPKVDDKKFQEIEASVNDLKKHAESSDLNSKATKGEIESMKKDLSQINESIKSLLNVYEAVSRQYNPFVDNEAPAPSVKKDESKEGSLSLGGDLSLGSLYPKDKKIQELKAEAAFDEEGPLDRIVKPEDTEDEPEFGSLGNMDLKASKKIEEPEPEVEELEPEPEPLLKPKSKKVSAADTYALEQVHKLCEYQMSKIYKARLIGEEPDPDEVETLDRWLDEFKRLGGG